jgi:hypothetical protein
VRQNRRSCRFFERGSVSDPPRPLDIKKPSQVVHTRAGFFVSGGGGVIFFIVQRGSRASTFSNNINNLVYISVYKWLASSMAIGGPVGGPPSEEV